MISRIALLCILLTSLPASAAAQACGPVRVGDRVRITVVSVASSKGGLPAPAPVAGEVETLEGIIQEFRQDTVFLTVDGRERRIHRERVVSLELRCVTRRIPVTTGLWVGAAGGALIGGAIGCAVGERDRRSDGWCDFNLNERQVLQWALVGAAVGAALGMVLASASAGRDWKPAEFPLRVAPTGDRQWEIRMSIPLGGHRSRGPSP